VTTSITRERAERIAKSQPCSHCLEYTFQKISVKPATPAIKKELEVEWVATRLCGVCKHQTEVGIADDGDVVYES
jgi:hypothetical protein